MFERAIEIDPTYGPALAGLATVYGTLYEWFGADDKNLRRAEAASRSAVALAPGLAEARVGRGFTLSLARQYDEAVHEFAEAIRINPNSFEAYYYFARASFANGDIARSAELFAKAAEVRREDFKVRSCWHNRYECWHGSMKRWKRIAKESVAPNTPSP